MTFLRSPMIFSWARSDSDKRTAPTTGWHVAWQHNKKQPHNRPHFGCDLRGSLSGVLRWRCIMIGATVNRGSLSCGYRLAFLAPLPVVVRIVAKRETFGLAWKVFLSQWCFIIHFHLKQHTIYTLPASKHGLCKKRNVVESERHGRVREGSGCD